MNECSCFGRNIDLLLPYIQNRMACYDLMRRLMGIMSHTTDYMQKCGIACSTPNTEQKIIYGKLKQLVMGAHIVKHVI